MKCRNCKKKITILFVDLGNAPYSNSYIPMVDKNKPEKWYPLSVYVCKNCWLVQTVNNVDKKELFTNNYSYLSSYSKTWLSHCEEYVKKMQKRFKLNKLSNVVEIASNDGALLQYVKKNGIQCIGVEPTESSSLIAKKKGIKTINSFFNTKLAKQMKSQKLCADLIVSNNVLAHVPNINDFVSGIHLLLKPGGVATFEFPHLLKLISYKQFDTIYHEHYSYLSLIAVKNIFLSNKLKIFDVEELPTHGGSLRVYAMRSDTGDHKISKKVNNLLKKELNSGLKNIKKYQRFGTSIYNIKYNLVNFLIKAKKRKKIVVAYGAAAKGNTLLNFSGIYSDLISFVADRNPMKQNKLMPGSKIPIVSENYIKKFKPNYIIIFPWNLINEIKKQLKYVQKWKCKLITAIPNLKIHH